MSECRRCEELPDAPSGTGVLYVAPPLAHTMGTVRGTFEDYGLRFDEPAGGVLAVEVKPEDLRALSYLLRERLSEEELRDSRALLTDRGVSPGIGELARTQNLATLTAAVRNDWLVEMLREDRLTVHFQPIVSADGGEIFAYECLLRGIGGDGSLVGPGPMFDAARAAGLLFNLDRAARMKAITEAAGHGIRQKIFVNFNPTSIYDPAYCLRSTMKTVERSGVSPDRIVFEITESDEVRDDRQLLKILAFYREHGFRVALDDLGAGYGSLKLLARLHPDFVKLDMGLVRDVDRDPYAARIAAKLLELANDLGVEVIAEGVETAEQRRWLTEHGAHHMQGYHFARPGSPPPVLSYA